MSFTSCSTSGGKMLTLKVIQTEEELEFEDSEFTEVIHYIQQSENNKFLFLRDSKPFMKINKVDDMLYFDRL